MRSVRHRRQVNFAFLGAATEQTPPDCAARTATPPPRRHRISRGDLPMSTFSAKDGTKLYYKEWGTGQPIVFSHGWPLTADAWEDQMLFLAGRGYRCIAHDRRRHGRSDQPSTGNDMDTYADDLAA